MTAVCALVHEGKVIIGADSAGTGGHSQSIREDLKVFVNGPMAFGFTSSFRMGQLLRWAFSSPIHPEGVSTERYMSTTFIDSVRECLKAGGWAHKENEVERGGVFIVGYKGRIWEVESDYQIGQNATRYFAVGSGYDLCLGAMYATEEFELDPYVRLGIALEAAARFNSTVRAPFHFVREP